LSACSTSGRPTEEASIRNLPDPPAYVKTATVDEGAYANMSEYEIAGVERAARKQDERVIWSFHAWYLDLMKRYAQGLVK
jgi:hypothetical protein